MGNADNKDGNAENRMGEQGNSVEMRGTWVENDGNAGDQGGNARNQGGNLGIAAEIQKLCKYLPSMKLDDYSFKLHQKCVDKERQLDNQSKRGNHHT